MKCILGKKLGMTSLYDEKAGRRSVTLIECPENRVVLVRTQEKDGYSAVQLEAVKTLKKNVLKEFRFSEKKDVDISSDQSVSIDMFQVGDKVNVEGVTKGKGFQGVVKRHGFKGAPKTHGHKHDLRAPGSIGSTFPEHIPKGRRMAGRLGCNRFTAQSKVIVYINKLEGLIGVQGSVPGVPGGVVKVYVKE